MTADLGQQIAASLTDRELTVLRLIAEGHTPRAITSKMYLSLGTVHNYLTRIRVKLGADTTAHAVHRAHQIGLLS